MSAALKQTSSEKDVLIYSNERTPPPTAPPGYMRFRMPLQEDGGRGWASNIYGLIRPTMRWEHGIQFNKKRAIIFDVIDLPVDMLPSVETENTDGWEPLDEAARAASEKMLKRVAELRERHALEQRRLLPGFRDRDEQDELAAARAETKAARAQAAELKEENVQLREQMTRMEGLLERIAAQQEARPAAEAPAAAEAPKESDAPRPGRKQPAGQG